MTAIITQPRVLNVPCRLCGAALSIPLPSEPAFERTTRMLATKACCDRCADFRRWYDDACTTLQRVTMPMVHATSDSGEATEIRGIVRKIAAKMVEKTQAHYRITGLSAHLDEFVSGIMDRPDTAEWQGRMFLRGAEKITQDMALEANEIP